MRQLLDSLENPPPPLALGFKPDRAYIPSMPTTLATIRDRVPEVLEPLPFVRAVQRVGANGVLLHNDSGLDPLEDLVDSPGVSLFVGPEGGWSEKELRLAGEAGLARAQLGPYRLRSETAGMFAVARARAKLESRNVVERR